MFARTTAKYVEEKVCSRQRLEALWLQPYVVLRRADISEAICPKQEPERTHIKEEDVGKEVQHFNDQMEQNFFCIIKKEEEPERPCNKAEGEDSCDIKDFYDIKKEEEEDACEMPLIGLPLKSLDEGQHEVSKGEEPPSCSSSQQLSRESDGDHCGGSQAAPPSDSDDVSSHVPAAAADNDESQNKHRQCSQCGFFFAHSSSLKQHMKIHTRKKNFSCSFSGQKLSKRTNLKRHTGIHTCEKPFSCSVCGQRFSDKGTLKRHTRIHTGEKPFSCSFVAKNSLRGDV
ncbi:zinc finger and SCAN domain-containing protein 31-like isoform X2 [Syngnathus acus]|uniref:zinc finger and SCAN domain-containing protein 31-like isoform X2 n=1 Tax=Syngnathus acus TaxID=161584 RepID=UPI001885B5FB|nr:zinc finger and SCAN domain-containing protein 31-like isoform X2 [Syngnathus acus]